MHDPEIVLQWLAATENIRQVRKSFVVAKQFARIFARHRGCSVSEVMGETAPVNWETLRTARVRADAVALLLFRRLWEQLPDTIDVYLYVDSSPQWHGEEMLATSFEIWDRRGQLPWQRRLMPLVSLERDFLDSIGKTIALVWQIWLLVGPSPLEVIRFCSRVRCIVTDCGTERLLANIVDVVPDMLAAMGSPLAEHVVERERTFEHAIQSPGWMHGWDVVLRRGLSSLHWFPSWLEKMKAIVYVFRLSTMVGQLCWHLKTVARLPAVAQMIEALKLPSIAEWRWGTLYKACRTLREVLGTLRVHFQFALFKNARDPIKVQRCASALRSDEWAWQFEFVCWFCEWLGSIQEWGRGCRCHEAELLDGSSGHVDCKWKGRRLKEAGEFVRIRLRAGLDECNAWTKHTFSCSDLDWTRLQACVRGSFHLAHARFKYLSLVPWLCARLLEPGVRDECLAQWASCSPEKHHPLTRRFCDPGSALRQDLDVLLPDCSNASERLRDEVDSVAALPMDDSYAESPHALAKRVKLHGRGAKFPWIASSMRLGQNLEDIGELAPALNMDTRREWCRSTSILQVNPQRAHRSMRLPRANFLNCFYRMAMFGRPRTRDEANEGDDDDQGDDPGDDDDDDGDAADAPKESDAGVGSGAAASSGQGPSGPGSVGPVSLALTRAERQTTSLMKEYMLACLSPSMYVSLPVPSGGGAATLGFFQVLSVQPRTTTVDVFTPDNAEPMDLCAVAIQSLDYHGPIDEDSSRLHGGDFFAFEEPKTFDVVGSTAARPSDRELCLEWEPTESAVPCCVRLCRPRPLRPPASWKLSDARVPALCLLDVLLERGFAPQSRRAIHKKGGEELFDDRKPTSKKSYLRCVIASAELFEAGVPEFSSLQTNAFFEYLLKHRRLPPPNLSAKQLRLLMKEDAIDMPSPLSLDCHTADPPVALPKLTDPDIACDVDVGDKVDVVMSETGIVGSADDMKSHEADADAVAAEAPEAPSSAVEWPLEVEGVRCYFKKAKHDGGWSYHDRLLVKCPFHEGCARSRSTALQVSTFGQKAAVYYLGVWVRAAWMPVGEHRAFQPDAESMRAYMREHELASST